MIFKGPFQDKPFYDSVIESRFYASHLVSDLQATFPYARDPRGIFRWLVIPHRAAAKGFAGALAKKVF